MKKIEQPYMTVKEVAEQMSISKSHAYKLMRLCNKELEQMGKLTVAGRISRKYFNERYYG